MISAETEERPRYFEFTKQMILGEHPTMAKLNYDPFPEAKMDDGIFHIARFGDIGVPLYLSKIMLLIKGKKIAHREVSYHESLCVRLESEDDVFIEADGELIGKLPAKFEILHKKLRIRR